MARSATTLANELENLEPTLVEAEAVSALADAFKTYFHGATVNGIAAVPSALTGAKNAMAAALVGMSASGAGPAKIQAGVVAFWGVVSVTATAALIWPGMSPPITGVTPPPGLSGLASSLSAVFASNTSGGLSLSAACTAIASAIHTANTGGLVAVGPPAASFTVL